MCRLLSAFVFLSMLLQPLVVASSVRPHCIYHTIAQDLLSPFDQEVVGEDAVDFAGDGNSDTFTEGQKRSIVFNLFSRFSTPHAVQYPVIDTRPIIKDLEIFTQTTGNLFRKICRTKTVFGQAVFARMLAEPTSDIPELHRRQEIVQALLSSPELFARAEQCLQEIQTIEPLLLSFFSQRNELRQKVLSDLYFNKELWGHFDINTDAWDKNPKLLMAAESASRLMQLLGLLLIYWRWDMAEQVAGRPFLVTITALYTLLLLKPKLFLKVAPFGVPASGAMLAKHASDHWAIDGSAGDAAQVRPDWQSMSAPSKAWYFVNTAVRTGYQKLLMLDFVLYTPYQLFLQGQETRNAYYKYRHLQQKFSQLQKAIERLHAVNKLLQATPQLIGKVVELQPMLQALEQRTGISDDLRKLLVHLEKPTFAKKFSLASNLGRIAATNKLMLGARTDWVRIFEAVGYLDAYMATARLLQQYGESSTSPWCFADFVVGQMPAISFADFWNPFVDPSKAPVVCNSLTLGKTARNMILTGPNTGGKSTVIKAIALNTLLAQAFGIVAARSCVITPFSVVRTYIRVEDDIERGLSLYRAEVERAKQMSSAVHALQPGQHALIIIDEMFRGTARDQAALLSYWYTKENLGAHPQCMLLEATHYPELINLEQETGGVFKNYKVEIERNPDGSLKRTYLLKEGFTTQNVAADILKEEGFVIHVG